MDDEFALCWNNFQDNIATGFQNLYDRGDLVDVTLACDGKLLQAHKIVLAICSPYFQEMFITNPCKHPIIILKDVGYSVMCELLQFMYQGVVNVKHTELPSFMKMAQTLQIKGLTTSSAQKSPNQSTTSINANNRHTTSSNESSSANIIETKINSAPTASKTSSDNSSPSIGPMKRELGSSESISIYPKKQMKRNSETIESDINNDSMENMNADEVFLPPIPQISMVESRFDLNNVKRELSDHPASPGSIRNSLPHPFNFEYNNMYSNKPIEYPNDLHMTNDYQKSIGNHMDAPPVAPGERWFQGKLEFMWSQRGKPLLVHDGHTFGIQYIRKDKKYWQCNLSRKFNCKARVTTTDTGEIIVTNNEHCHTEIRQHLRKDYHRNKLLNTGSNPDGGNSSSNCNTSSQTDTNSHNFSEKNETV